MRASPLHWPTPAMTQPSPPPPSTLCFSYKSAPHSLPCPSWLVAEVFCLFLYNLHCIYLCYCLSCWVHCGSGLTGRQVCQTVTPIHVRLLAEETGAKCVTCVRFRGLNGCSNSNVRWNWVETSRSHLCPFCNEWHQSSLNIQTPPLISCSSLHPVLGKQYQQYGFHFYNLPL